MPITAVVLLRGEVAPEGLETEALAGGTLVKTSIRFDLEPSELGEALRARLGAALDHQDDARGVFVLPEVALGAARDARSYDAALEAVGDGGAWVRTRTVGGAETMEDRALGMDDILAQALSGRPVDPALLASLLGGMPDHGEDDEDDDDGTAAAADGEEDDDANAPIDLGALMSSPLIQQMMAQMAEALAASPDAQRELEGAGKDGGLDLEALAKSPAIAKLIEGFGQTLGNDPAALASLLGGTNDDDE